MDLRRSALYLSRTRVGLGLVMMASPRLAFGPIYGPGAGEPAREGAGSHDGGAGGGARRRRRDRRG